MSSTVAFRLVGRENGIARVKAATCQSLICKSNEAKTWQRVSRKSSVKHIWCSQIKCVWHLSNRILLVGSGDDPLFFVYEKRSCSKGEEAKSRSFLKVEPEKSHFYSLREQFVYHFITTRNKFISCYTMNKAIFPINYTSYLMWFLSQQTTEKNAPIWRAFAQRMYYTFFSITFLPLLRIFMLRVCMSEGGRVQLKWKFSIWLAGATEKGKHFKPNVRIILSVITIFFRLNRGGMPVPAATSRKILIFVHFAICSPLLVNGCQPIWFMDNYKIIFLPGS